MCDPMAATAGAGFAIQGIGAMAGYGAQRQQADQINRQSYFQGIFNNMALAQTYNSLQNERTGQRNAASNDLFVQRLHGAAARATAVTAGGQAGAEGASLEGIIKSYDQAQGRQESATKQNYALKSQSINDQMQAAYTGGVAKNMALPRANKPSLLSLGLQIAGAGVNAVGSYYSYTRNPAHAPLSA